MHHRKNRAIFISMILAVLLIMGCLFHPAPATAETLGETVTMSETESSAVSMEEETIPESSFDISADESLEESTAEPQDESTEESSEGSMEGSAAEETEETVTEEVQSESETSEEMDEEETTEEITSPEEVIFASQWYKDGYESGLYRNKDLDYTIGWKYQNETIENILAIHETLAAYGWDPMDFFSGTVFQGLDVETLTAMQEAGMEELDISMMPSLLSFSSSYALACTASSQFKSFSMDIYDDEHGTLYLLGLGDHNAFCINYGKHSPKGTTYSQKLIDSYLTASQQEVLKQGLMYFLWLQNSVEGGSKVWGTATDITNFSNTSGYYLYMQIWTWAAMKGYDAYGCADVMRDVIIDWSSSNTSWANGYYNLAVQFLDGKLYEKYMIDVSVYSSGNSSNQDMYVYDMSTITLVRPSKSMAQVTKTSTDGSRLTDAGFTLYQWNSSSYSKVGTLTHAGNGVYQSSVVIDYNSTNQGKWRIQETTTPANHVTSTQYVDFNITEELVKIWYTKFLGRTADSGGLSTWSGKLINGTSEYEVMRSIALSSEANGKSNAVFTTACYNTIFGTEPTSDNLTYWNSCLTNGTHTRSSMFNYFWHHAKHDEILAGAAARATLSFEMENTKHGKIKVVKKSANTSITSGNSNYALNNAVYGIYSDSACKKQVTTVTTDANGTATSGWLAPGTYYVKEKTASKGYTVNVTANKVTVTTAKTVTVNSLETPITGSIKVIKSSTTGSGPSFAGAVYGVYTNSACTTLKTKITLDANGEGTTTGLPLGTYYVKEITAPEGYYLDTEVYTAVCKNASVVTVYSEDEPKNNMAIHIGKVNSDGDILSGSSFLVEIWDETSKTWKNPYAGSSDPVIAAMKNERETDANGEIKFTSLASGTYRITEVNAPDGYALLTEPIIVELPVKVLSSQSPGGEDYTENGYDIFLTYELTVHNGNVLKMPYTGGVGMGIVLVGGMITAAGSLMVIRKRRE